MPDMSKTGTASKLNEYALRDELREMRKSPIARR